ncbi:MAG: hypothetical protein JO334_04820 [Verrucomicrobia bacterium]|nr:hypothetical protein [Verrucomicrobiota bacterium]
MSRRQDGSSRTGVRRERISIEGDRRATQPPLIFEPNHPGAVRHWRFWSVARSTHISLGTGLRSTPSKSPKVTITVMNGFSEGFQALV